MLLPWCSTKGRYVTTFPQRTQNLQNRILQEIEGQKVERNTSWHFAFAKFQYSRAHRVFRVNEFST